MTYHFLNPLYLLSILGALLAQSVTYGQHFHWENFYNFDSQNASFYDSLNYNTNLPGYWRYGKLTSGLPRWTANHNYVGLQGTWAIQNSSAKLPFFLKPNPANPSHYQLSAYYDASMYSPGAQRRVRIRPLPIESGGITNHFEDTHYFKHGRTYRYTFTVRVDDKGTPLEINTNNANWLSIHEAWQTGGSAAFAIHINNINHPYASHVWEVSRSTDQGNVSTPVAVFSPNTDYRFDIIYRGVAPPSTDGILAVTISRQGASVGSYLHQGATLRSIYHSPLAIAGHPLDAVNRRARPAFQIYTGWETAPRLTSGVEAIFDKISFDAFVSQ